MEMIIGGKKVTKPKMIKVYNPFNGEIVGEVPDAEVSDVKVAIELAEEGKKL